MLLYIHIPFCSHKCGYCSFASLPASKDLHAPYVRALCAQLEWELERFCARKQKITSVYIGGGTPSLIDSSLFAPLFERFSPFLDSCAEITIEANPLSVNLAWATNMRALGVNRVSLGVQSFFSDKLLWLERDHEVGAISRAIDSLQEAGIAQLSIDLLYDTPFDTRERLAQEIERACEFPIGHISAYSLTLEEGSRFYARGVKSGESSPKNAQFVREKLAEKGFTQYEVSNYTKDHISRHNLGYWESCEYIGVGAGAIGRIGSVRYAPHRDFKRYIAEPLWRENEYLSEEDLRFERLFLGLRSCVGINKKGLDKAKLTALVNENKVRENGDKIVASDYFLADEIALYLS
ncbi:MAG: radical SAM family heme chaperone HemW [Wolinella sp.]